LWLILIVIGLFLLLMCLRIRFRLTGRWQEALDYTLSIGVGPLYIDQQTLDNGERGTVIRLGQQVLIRKAKLPKTAAKAKAKAAAQEKHSLKDLKPFLQGGFLKGILRTIQAILSRIDERELRLAGCWGFEEPYYTGLLAAFGPLIPGFQVEPVFGAECRDLEFTMAGRLSVGKSVYYLLKFMLARESRQVWRTLRQQKKEKNTRKNATSGNNTVYSTVKQ